VLDLVKAGVKTGASTRNWHGYGTRVDLGRHGDFEQTLLTDPQTSGGLLVTCAPDAVERVLDVFRSEGFGSAAVIGEIRVGTPSVEVL
jgi:selenide,water dikinase